MSPNVLNSHQFLDPNIWTTCNLKMERAFFRKTRLLTNRHGILTEKAGSWTRRIMTVFTTALQWLPSNNPPHILPNHFYKTHFNILFPSTLTSSEVSFSPQQSVREVYIQFRHVWLLPSSGRDKNLAPRNSKLFLVPFWTISTDLPSTHLVPTVGRRCRLYSFLFAICRTFSYKYEEIIPSIPCPWENYANTFYTQTTKHKLHMP